MSPEIATVDDVAALTDLLNEAYRPAEAFLYEDPRTSMDEVTK